MSWYNMVNPSDDPTDIEFARRFIKDYLDVDSRLKNNLALFKGISTSDINSASDDQIRMMIRDNIKPGVDKDAFMNLDSWNTAYFNFFVNIVDLLTQDVDGNVDVQEVVTQTVADYNRQSMFPGKLDAFDDEDEFTKRDELFIQSRINKDYKVDDVIKDYFKSKIVTPKTKTSIINKYKQLRK